MPTPNRQIYNYNSEGDRLAHYVVSTIHWYQDNRCYILDPLNRVLASGETLVDAKAAFREAMKQVELVELLRPKYKYSTTRVKVPAKEIEKFRVPK